jgi:hypothetical protein
LNAHSTLSHIEVVIADGAILMLSNGEGGRMRVPGPAVLVGTISEVRGLQSVVFPSKRGFSIALKRPTPKEVEGFVPIKPDDLWTAWDDERVTVTELLPGGKRREYFDG